MCCSIIGYLGVEGAARVLVRGLKRMEYRGYDSVGVATAITKESNSGTILLRKGTGNVTDVNSKVMMDALPGRVGIGHTRWATHGKITDANAHPHSSSTGQIAIVHNGIITNFEEIKSELESQGYTFKSETDSEVIANLLQKNYTDTKDIKKTISKTISKLEGEYAFVAMFDDGTLAAARLGEPLIVGIGRDDLFLSSDVLGFIEYTDKAVYIENESIVLIKNNAFEVMDFACNPIEYQVTRVSKEFGDAYKGKYAHFTLKEIYEQSETVITAGNKTTNAITDAAKYIKMAKNVYITGSGTSYNSALIAKQIFSKYAKIKIEAIMSSEIQFALENIESGSVVIAISQSGESADVLEAIRIAKNLDCVVISIVNMMMSSLVRESDIVIGINCGPEIGVAATKSFTSQLVVLYKIIQELGGNTNMSFVSISEAISSILEDPTQIQQIAKELKDISDIYVLGRGVHYPIAIESALKIKELTYVHAEGMPGGELKHGPLALIDSDVFIIIINPTDHTYSESITTAREIKTRGAKIIGISDKDSDIYDYWIQIPKGDETSYPITEIVPIQLLSYYIALGKNTDPDYPRNLAKSVTVK